MSPRSSHPARIAALLTALLCLTDATAANRPPRPPRTAPAPAPSGPKTHSLFMGANLYLFSADGSLFPVRDVRNNSFVAADRDRPIVADSKDNKFRLKIDDALKLSADSATIDDLKLERSYTLDNDPMEKFRQATEVAAYFADRIDDANLALGQAERRSGLADAGVAAVADSPNAEVKAPALAQQAAANTSLASAGAASDAANAMLRSDLTTPSTGSTRLTAELAEELYDALNVSFSLSTHTRLREPYLVVIMRYFAEKGRKDSANVWVYAEKLTSIDEHPKKYLIRRGGFPPGYVIDSLHVHLYDGGKEIATNVSRKRVELTTQEAFDYYVIDYVATNKDQTRAPAKAKSFWPADLGSRFVPDKLTRPLFVKVAKDGTALGLFEDEQCAHPLADADLAALAPELRFLPALDKGKPVEAVATIKLAESL